MEQVPMPPQPEEETQESLYEKALAKMNADEYIVQYEYKRANDLAAAAAFDELGDYRDAREKAAQCRERAQQAQADGYEYTYSTLKERMAQAQRAEDWERSAEGFEQLSGYKDSDALRRQCLQELSKLEHRSIVQRVTGIAVAVILIGAIVYLCVSGLYKYPLAWGYMKSGAYENARIAYSQMGDFLDSKAMAEKNEFLRLEHASPGETVTFGDYKWKVLSADGGERLLILAEVEKTSQLYTTVFSRRRSRSTWERSTLRNWLNGRLLRAHFSETERAHMLLQESRPSTNETGGTAFSQTTYDYITILSAEETEIWKDHLASLGGDWWLRTPGANAGTAAFYNAQRQVVWYGCDVTEKCMQVRPVIRVSLEPVTSETETTPEAVLPDAGSARE